MMVNLRTAALGSVLLLLSGGAVVAQDAGNYPNRPIVMIVPFAPGGASDFVARMIQQGVGEILGQQVVVDNRPGAAGMVDVDLDELLQAPTRAEAKAAS
jgi:tripartite-type tricarboxylate transporter receptor subunit TctC